MSNRTLPPVAADLVRAKKRIEDPENWCKGSYNLGESYCLLGALGYGIDPFENYDSFGKYDELICTKYAAHVVFLVKALPSEFRLAGLRLHIYNDNETTTHQEIMDLYDRAIALAIEKNK